MLHALYVNNGAGWSAAWLLAFALLLTCQSMGCFCLRFSCAHLVLAAACSLGAGDFERAYAYLTPGRFRTLLMLLIDAASISLHACDIYLTLHVMVAVVCRRRLD